MTARLSVRDLTVELRQSRRVEKTGFDLKAGEVLSVVGESGSGKSMMARALMGLLPPKAIAKGSAVLDRHDILAAAAVPPRGTGIGLVFQQTMTALTPVLNIGLQLTEALESHGICDRAAARCRAVAMLEAYRRA